ncbi:MAG TPA: dsRBD fold-containing protein [Acidimicrobiia bacterium]|nr:dsRBD fold-containing protein [Acidimicrobiia bacterium]
MDGRFTIEEELVEQETDVVLSIHLTEDDTSTIATAVLDLRGDHFQSEGRARRNPGDPPQPVIGEELAIARALAGLEDQITEAAQDKIERFIAQTK